MDAWIMFGAVLLAGYLLRYGQDRERREAEFRKGVAWGKTEERQARRRLSWCCIRSSDGSLHRMDSQQMSVERLLSEAGLDDA